MTTARSGQPADGRRLTAGGVAAPVELPEPARALPQPARALPQPVHLVRQAVGEVIAAVQVGVLIAAGVFGGAGQPVARSSPSAAITASRWASATIWCTREGDSPIAVARVRIEIPSARAETSAHVRSRPAWSSRHAARETRVRTRRSRRAAAIRSLIVTRPACQPRSGNWTP